MCATSQRIRLMCFHLPVCHLLFLQKPKPPRVSIETFLRICRLFVRFFFNFGFSNTHFRYITSDWKSLLVLSVHFWCGFNILQLSW